jgi:hypothetical protein
MKKVLFGLNQNPNKEIENRINDRYEKETGQRFEFDSEYYIDGIWKALREKEYDTLILKEDLEASPVKIDFLDNLTDNYPNLQIIFVINDTHERDTYVKQLFNLGIYNILYKEDLKIPNIIELIQSSRTKMDAKIYLDIDEIEAISKDSDMETINDNELEKIFINLRIATVDEISTMFTEISNSYNDKQMLFLVSLLSSDVKDKLAKSGNDNFEKHHKRWLMLDNQYVEAEAQPSGKPSTTTSKKEVVTKTITRVETQYVQYTPSDYNKIVAFVGDRKAGTTTIIDFVAMLFSKRGKKVAVLDLTENKTLYYMKCWGDTALTTKEKRSLELLNERGNHPIVINGNYKLYTQIEKPEMDDYEFDFINAIEQIRYESDIILIDMDFQSPCEWLKFGVSSIFVVNDLNILGVKTTKDYVKNIVEKGVNNKKINLIINKFIKSKVRAEDILVGFTQPLRHLEYENEINCLDISRGYFAIDFDIETYQNLISSYLFEGGEAEMSEKIQGQVLEICNHIYPLTKENKKRNGLGRLLKDTLKELNPFKQ